MVPVGTLLVQIDKRNPQNALNQASALLEAARARQAIAAAQSKRASTLLDERIINEVDFEQSQLKRPTPKRRWCGPKWRWRLPASS